jgi:hypothetical protein
MMIDMNEKKLQAKQLAKIRLEARKGRVSAIRRRIAVFGVTLMVAFSGLVVAVNGMPLVLGSGSEPQGTEVVQTDGVEQQVGATVIAFAGQFLEGDDDEEEEEGGGFFDTGTSASVQSSQS